MEYLVTMTTYVPYGTPAGLPLAGLPVQRASGGRLPAGLPGR
jgi:hypothetical protein